MKKNFLIVLVVLISGMNAYTITPQKYCESLAASSCEVLNIEGIRDPTASSGAPIGWDIKYCKDRVLKNRYFVKASSSSDCFNGSPDYDKTCIYVESSHRYSRDTVYANGSFYNGVYVSIDGSLCSKTYSTTGSNVKNVLP